LLNQTLFVLFSSNNQDWIFFVIKKWWFFNCLTSNFFRVRPVSRHKGWNSLYKHFSLISVYTHKSKSFTVFYASQWISVKVKLHQMSVFCWQSACKCIKCKQHKRFCSLFIYNDVTACRRSLCKSCASSWLFSSAHGADGTPPGARLFSERLGTTACLSFINMIKLKTFRRYEGCNISLYVHKINMRLAETVCDTPPLTHLLAWIISSHTVKFKKYEIASGNIILHFFLD